MEGVDQKKMLRAPALVAGEAVKTIRMVNVFPWMANTSLRESQIPLIT
jgi:hypothetical protein